MTVTGKCRGAFVMRRAAARPVRRPSTAPYASSRQRAEWRATPWKSSSASRRGVGGEKPRRLLNGTAMMQAEKVAQDLQRPRGGRAPPAPSVPALLESSPPARTAGGPAPNS